MRLPTLKRVLKEDVKGAPSWINALLDTLNSFMESIYQGMNRNITFRENIACQIKTLTYTTPSTYPAGVINTRFMSELKTKANGVMLLQVYNKADYEPPVGPVYIPWTEENGDIVLRTVTGLSPDTTYILTLLVT